MKNVICSYRLPTLVDLNYEDLYLLTYTSGFESWPCHVRRKISTLCVCKI